MSFLRLILGRFGVDRAVAYSVLAQGWSVAAGPVSIFLIARNLTLVEQGIYYTFGSLLAIQLFFELGLTTLLVTFAAHETAHLSWTDTGELDGEPDAKSRLRSLLRNSLRWYSTLALIFMVVVFTIGFYFFRQKAEVPRSTWLVPWMGMVLTTGLNLVIVPCVATLEGCGLVKELTVARLRQTILANVVFWAVLLAGGGLLAAAVSTFLGWCAVAFWVYGRRGMLLGLLRSTEGTAQIHWGREIWPLQWKLAVSWVSGYFMFQTFTPVLFWYQGPAAAAQMGMSLNLSNRISALAQTWMSTKAPTFASLAGRRDYPALDRIFFKSALSSTAVAASLGIVLWSLTLVLHLIGSPYAARMLALPSLALLLTAMIVSLVNSAETYYMRAHKEEPLAALWPVLAVVIGAGTYFFGRYYGAQAMIMSYCTIMILSCAAVSTPIFLACRRRYQQRVLTAA